MLMLTADCNISPSRNDASVVFMVIVVVPKMVSPSIKMPDVSVEAPSMEMPGLMPGLSVEVPSMEMPDVEMALSISSMNLETGMRVVFLKTDLIHFPASLWPRP